MATSNSNGDGDRHQTAGQDSSARRPLLAQGPVLSTNDLAAPRYGSTDGADSVLDRSRRRSSPEVFRRESLLNRVPEEEPLQNEPEADASDSEEMEWSLEEQGLYSGSYRRTIALYTFVPLSSALLLAFLALCPELFWKSRHNPGTHPPYYPSPLPELIISAALWAFCYLMRTPLFTLCSFAVHNSLLVTLLFNALHAIVYNFCRVSALPLLRIRDQMRHRYPTWDDPTFYRVWWIALGWATIDVGVSIIQSYSQLALYRNVMVPEDRLREVAAQRSTADYVSPSEEVLPLSPRCEAPKRTDSPRTLEDAIRNAVDQDLEQLVNLKEREDVEEIYGLPPIRIPVFISCLQRIDSILLSTGITLSLSASYLHSSLSQSIPHPDNTSSSNRPFLIALPLVLILNFFLNILYTPLILPRVGLHTTSYIGLLLGLGSFFTGLGLWDALS